MTLARGKGSFELDLVGVRVFRGRLRRLLLAAGTALLLSPLWLSFLRRVLDARWAEALDGASGVSSLAGVVMLLIAAVVSRRWTAERAARLSVEAGVLRIEPRDGGAYVSRAEALESGWVDSREGTATVLLQKRDRDVFAVRTQNAAEANALLDSLGLGALQRTQEVSFGSRAARGAAFALLTAVASCFTAPLLDDINRVLLGGYSVGLALALVVASYALVAYGLFAVFAPLRVSIGRDGVGLRFSVWKFFLNYSTVREVSQAGDYIYFALNDGRTERFYAPARADVRQSAVERINTALEAYRAGEKGRALLSLERGDRSVSEWRTGVRVLAEGAGAGSYRAEYVDEPTLVATLEDDGAPAERRVGAALALLASDPSGERAARVRSVAAGCASAPLREALEQALAPGGDGDARLDRALAEVRRVRSL